MKVELVNATDGLPAATTGTGGDLNDTLEYYDGATWKTHNESTPITYPTGSNILLVRTTINNDNVYEFRESYGIKATLQEADGSGGYTDKRDINNEAISAVVNGVIGDDGTGEIYNQSGGEVNEVHINPNSGKTYVWEDDRPLRVNTVNVNEGSDYDVFAIETDPGAYRVTLAITNENLSDFPDATAGTDFANSNTLEWSDTGADGSWQPYTQGLPLTIANQSLFARIAIINDTLSEGPEEFNLKVTAVAGSAEPGDYTGQAVIYDNQMGQLMTGNVSNGVVDTDVTSSLDDDFDKDGIPPNVEQALADLANAAGKGGGKPGDLNNDGLLEKNQSAVTTMA